jgi:hypothetical protein
VISQCTTDEVLKMMEAWLLDLATRDPDSYQWNAGQLAWFADFDRLLGKNLNFVNLSKEEIERKTQEWVDRNPGTDTPPHWISFFTGGINFRGAVLAQDVEGQRTELRGVQLQGADLSGAQLEGATLGFAKLQGTDFASANLDGAYLANAEFEEAHLEHVQWNDKYILGDEIHGTSAGSEPTYRRLKQYYIGTGSCFDICGDLCYFDS